MSINQELTQELNQAANEVRNKPKKSSEYERIVLSSNQALKLECKTLGYAFKMIIETKGVNSELIKQAKEVQRNKAIYDDFALTVRKTKKGSFVPFYCMQLLYNMMAVVKK